MGFGYMIVWITARIYYINPYIALVPCLLIGGSLNAVIYFSLYSRLKVNEALKLLCLLGVEVVYHALNQIIGFTVRELPQYRTIDFAFIVGEYDAIIYGVPASFLFSLSLLIAILASTRVYPRYWLTLRSIKENPCLTSIQGVDTKRFTALTWGIAGALACFCGGVSGFWVVSSPSSGDAMVSYMLVGCILGGLGSLTWMVVGGGLVGALCALIIWGGSRIGMPWLGEYLGLIPVFVIAVTLWFKPDGLYGWYVKRFSWMDESIMFPVIDHS